MLSKAGAVLSKRRLALCSDAVMAIVMTILLLDLPTPLLAVRRGAAAGFACRRSSLNSRWCCD
jgi:uncharacterized membrane protein